ncbi:putative membrane protein [Rickettsiales bacterium Ac37b]|nr:putative membrane protein [Rickettsiales bacterium Ac37b]
MLQYIPSIALVFLGIWVIIFFMALPIGIKIPERPKVGYADSAPEDSKLWIKTIVTTLLSALFTGIFVWWRYFK